MASSSESSTRATVVIVGAGAAGIFTAYQIATQHPGTFDVRIFEAAPAIGGNVSSVTVEYGGQTYVIDAGAEFYYPNPQPHYVQLVSALGLTSTSYPAGFTVWESSTGQRLLWIPSRIGRFARYTARDWEAFLHFCGFVVAATWLNATSPENWTLSVSDWLAGIPEWLMPASFAPVIEAFLYQFVSLPMGQIGQSSALYATTYFVRNIFGTLPAVAGDDTPTFSTYQNDSGLLSVLQAALTASDVSAQTRSPVTAVAPGRGTVAVTVGGTTIDARYVGTGVQSEHVGDAARGGRDGEPGSGAAAPTVPVYGAACRPAAERFVLDAERSDVLGTGQHRREHAGPDDHVQCLVGRSPTAVRRRPADSGLQVMGRSRSRPGVLQLRVLFAHPQRSPADDDLHAAAAPAALCLPGAERPLLRRRVDHVVRQPGSRTAVRNGHRGDVVVAGRGERAVPAGGRVRLHGAARSREGVARDGVVPQDGAAQEQARRADRTTAMRLGLFRDGR